MDAGSSKGKQVVVHDVDEYTKELVVGFKFHPTEEELITYYLTRWINNQVIPINIFKEVNIYSFKPEQLIENHKPYEGIWYIFSPRDRKYAGGGRPSRSTSGGTGSDETGYWKATGADREILDGKLLPVGYKKVLVFYEGKTPNGTKTNWSMHEYRLQREEKDLSNRLQPVLCKVYEKNKKDKSDQEDNNEDAANVKGIENHGTRTKRARSDEEEKSGDTANITNTQTSSDHIDKKDPLLNESFKNTEESAFTHSPYLNEESAVTHAPYLTVHRQRSYQSVNNYHSIPSHGYYVQPPHGYPQPSQSFSHSYQSFTDMYNPIPCGDYHVGPPQSFNNHLPDPSYLPHLNNNLDAGPCIPNNFDAVPNNFDIEPSFWNNVDSIMPSSSNMLSTESTKENQHQTMACPKQEFTQPVVEDDVDQYLVSDNGDNFPQAIL